MPAFVSVEPAAICQLHCPECPVGMGNKSENATQKTPLMTREVWERVLGEIKETAHTVQFYFQGEPLLNKDLPAMIAEAHEAGLYTIVSTNAQALTPTMAEALVKAGLSRIIISMDGLTQESYNAYRIGGSLEKTKDAIRYLRNAKEKYSPLIELQVLRLRSNEHEWQEFEKQYKALGADRLMFKTAQLYNYSAGHPLMPSNPRYSRYIQGEDGLYHRKPLHRGCLRVWSGVVITTAGEVLPCCYDKSHAYSYGTIMDAPLKELYANEKAMAFRNAAANEKPQICQECWR
ncbi:MAG: radical SAM protein [Paludibacteraceae bacterium]|nr:radical SAM protein [Paludibacteraceae bacterium]